MEVRKMKKFNFDIVGKRKIFVTISCVLIAAIAAVSVFLGVKIDIQFSGGAIFTYSYEGNLDTNKLKPIAEKALSSGVNIQDTKNAVTGKDNIKISLIEAGAVDADVQAELSNTLEKEFPDNKIEMVDVTNVDPTIGGEFFAKCMVAIGFAFILMVLYIAVRFRKIGGWSAGIFAIVSLLHDAIFVFGTFVIFRIPLNNNFVAAVLTILGYSINSTIVLYDRIRENKSLGIRGTTAEIVNKSINETLMRTLNSSFTTIAAMVIVCVVALVFNIESILSFAFPLVIGLIAGAYSSTCLSGPLWVSWQEHKLNKLKEAGKSKKSKA